jgi:hypothetical protein
MGKAVTGMVRDPEVVQEILELEGIEPDSPIDDPEEKPGPSGPPGTTLHDED